MTEHAPADGWFKSSRSSDNAACVEVRLGADTIGVRDSKDVSGPALAFDPAAWTGFLTTLKTAAPGS
ncbi:MULTISPECIES: DUF397 domain-containing protein [unclassified Solwaraspora]|uniref:DUF397 domain-containing protein n=1 Tax=unclassified Solwaraspora TaxID=2627926 RepID=UPI00259BA957|nr:DUF397 domain-containing protein [Solwaraspora sp. WMMA2056]WJK38316.1 DUF397 domain-containing protein [Solwaraspora sp. WMMA2056]